MYRAEKPTEDDYPNRNPIQGTNNPTEDICYFTEFRISNVMPGVGPNYIQIFIVSASGEYNKSRLNNYSTVGGDSSESSIFYWTTTDKCRIQSNEK